MSTSTKQREIRASLTPEEKRAIASLHRLAGRWPASLWLFSAAGSLCVMKRNLAGEPAMLPGFSGGVDPDYHMTTIDIPNDGGDW